MAAGIPAPEYMDWLHSTININWEVVVHSLLGIDETVDDDDDSQQSPGSNKRKRQRVGRIPKGKCFWSKTDEYLKEIAQRGRNLKDARWKLYIDKVIMDDKTKFFGLTPGEPVLALLNESPVLVDPFEIECIAIATGHAFQNALHLNAALLHQVMLFKMAAI
ncbi:hypothetical protein B0H13DRAFT_2310206 [Mycena leptocephala]|nr:hypothetical protein B0H13DRAFT_2310206 [Mycena leptocephala]